MPAAICCCTAETGSGSASRAPSMRSHRSTVQQMEACKTQRRTALLDGVEMCGRAVVDKVLSHRPGRAQPSGKAAVCHGLQQAAGTRPLGKTAQEKRSCACGRMGCTSFAAGHQVSDRPAARSWEPHQRRHPVGWAEVSRVRRQVLVSQRGSSSASLRSVWGGSAEREQRCADGAVVRVSGGRCVGAAWLSQLCGYISRYR